MHIHILQHADFENPGYILDWAKTKGHRISFTNFFEAFKIPLPTDFDLLVVMGAPMSVNDEEHYPWLVEEKAFIHDSIHMGKKVLGICFGSQLIANALGSKVYPNTHKEIGWFPVHKPKGVEHPLLGQFPESSLAFHWHGDTFDLPKDAVRLFFSEATPNQGFFFGKKTLALQFHWEIGPDDMKMILDVMGEDDTKNPFVQPFSELMNASGFESNKKYMNSVLDFMEQLD